MKFSESSTQLGILERVRNKCRVDANQWPTARVVGSVNDCMDWLAGVFIGKDKRFQWDDTNHTKMPIGTTNLVANQREYSFLTDEQGNRILTLTRIDWKDANGNWTQLQEIDQATISPEALDEFEDTSGNPMYYDKTNDNVIKLYPASDTSVTAGLKFYFQRTPSYFTASDTTKEPGFNSIPHSIFVNWASYDCADTLGLENRETLFRTVEQEKLAVNQGIANRNNDNRPNIRATIDVSNYM
jgi:hypothetical protein